MITIITLGLIERWRVYPFSWGTRSETKEFASKFFYRFEILREADTNAKTRTAVYGVIPFLTITKAGPIPLTSDYMARKGDASKARSGIANLENLRRPAPFPR